MNQNLRLGNIIWWAAAFLMASLLVFTVLHVPRDKPDDMAFPQSRLEIQRVDGSKVTFNIEIATTPEQQEHGLMFRKHLAPDAGMIFVWPDDEPVSMWMKNTLIPLDMLFVTRDGKIVKVAANAVPEDLTPISANQPIRAVIEIGGNEAARQKIGEGDRVLFSAFEP